MRVRALCAVLFCALLCATGASVAHASEPRLCGPQSAILKFADHEHELALDVRFYDGVSDCTFDYERLENVRPVSITIHFNGREFRLGKECIGHMKFDLHGIRVEFSEGSFVIWFKESHKAVPDDFERIEKAVSVWLTGGLPRCEFPGGATW